MKDLINYNPDGKSHLSDEMCEEGKRKRLHPVHIICDEPNACVGDETGISFFALTAFIPREGDRISLEDGRSCKVKTIFYQVVTERNHEEKAKLIFLVPNVYACIV